MALVILAIVLTCCIVIVINTMVNIEHDCNKNGHRFEPRYNEEPIGQNVEINAYIMATQPELVKSMTTKTTYVCDVCVRCGKIVKKDEQGA